MAQNALIKILTIRKLLEQTWLIVFSVSLIKKITKH